MKARLIAIHDLAPDIRQLDFEVEDASLSFVPGQFLSLHHSRDGKEITRAYSIASPRSGNRFSLCLNRVADGLISPHLFSLKPGDEVETGAPLGYFTLRRPERKVLFIATGTGIAPFRSMLLDHLPHSPAPITLLFGARHEYGLLYRLEFEKLAEAYPGFLFLPTLTMPTETWPGRTGRVQLHLDEALSFAGSADLAATDVYICGMKEMVDQVRAELKQRGLDRKQIIYEKYD